MDRKHRAMSKTPFISVIIPNFNRARQVHSALGAFWRRPTGTSKLSKALSYEVTAKLLTKQMMMQVALNRTRTIAPRMRVNE